MRVRLTLLAVVGLVLVALLAGVLLFTRPLVLLQANSVSREALVSVFYHRATVCQRSETLPRGTTAIRLALIMAVGSPLTLEVRSGERVLVRGSKAAGWRGQEVTIATGRVQSTVPNATVCFHYAGSSEPIGLIGTRTRPALAATVDGAPARGRLTIEYLTPSHRTWWAQALPVVRRWGIGHAWSGSGVVVFLALLMGSAIALTSWLAVDRLR